MKHIRSHVRRVQAYLLEKDREGMTPDEREASIARQKRVQDVTAKHAKMHLKRILSPFYKPALRTPPAGVQEVLDRYARKAAVAV